MASDLYHNRVLELAANIDHLDPIAGEEARVEKVSRVCGSTVEVAIRLSDDGERVEAIQVDPKACALGQAATAILAKDAVGASVSEIREALEGLRAMLKENADPPSGRFWELRHLQGVADYPPRHTSTILAFDAAAAAIDQALKARTAQAAITS